MERAERLCAAFGGRFIYMKHLTRPRWARMNAEEASE